MKLISFLQFLLAQSAASFSIPLQALLSPLASPAKETYPSRIPTVEESAAMARRMLRLESIGTLSTVYPSSYYRSDVAGSPLGLVDYFADCEPTTGNPTLLGMRISSSYSNAAAGSNMTLSIQWHPPTSPTSRPYSTMEMPRFAVIGTVERMELGIVDRVKITQCYAKYHPDSVVWMPGNQIHESYWMRLVVTEVYWLGGFGSRAYIGWIPLETWKAVTEEDIEKTRLPGEEEEKSLWNRWFGSLEL